MVYPAEPGYKELAEAMPQQVWTEIRATLVCRSGGLAHGQEVPSCRSGIAVRTKGLCDIGTLESLPGAVADVEHVDLFLFFRHAVYRAEDARLVAV